MTWFFGGSFLVPKCVCSLKLLIFFYFKLLTKMVENIAKTCGAGERSDVSNFLSLLLNSFGRFGLPPLMPARWG